MKFEIKNNSISSYKRLSYDAWYAFAEFVDNSTQAYFDNKKKLDAEYSKTGDKLRIAIHYDAGEDYITIHDNSIGMNAADLERAFKIGQPPPDPTGRSKYGLGMKTAACWFGDNWSITTKKLGETTAYTIEIDVDAIAKKEGEVDLPPTEKTEGKETHYTTITITNLNRKFVGRTIGKIKDFLGSIYRFDISEGVVITWNNTPLVYHRFEDELYISPDGEKFKKYFELEINEKPVKGWVGVLGKGFGSRDKAGFAIIQNKRVIQGWPNGYKPSSIFGEQQDGSNDLVNQRVIGELFLDKFSVSHTKDKIVWEDDEEERLDKKLGEVCAEAKELALTLRFNKEPGDQLAKFKEAAVSTLTSELKSNEISNHINNVNAYPEKILLASYKRTMGTARDENSPVMEVNVGDPPHVIRVIVYFNEKSEFDPYVLSEATIEDDKLFIFINMLHPHIQEMVSADSLTNFIRHCIYDGISEWKAIRVRGSIQPNTVKFFKDDLLRVPFEIKTNKAV
jgi:hypothetical protein